MENILSYPVEERIRTVKTEFGRAAIANSNLKVFHTEVDGGKWVVDPSGVCKGRYTVYLPPAYSAIGPFYSTSYPTFSSIIYTLENDRSVNRDILSQSDNILVDLVSAFLKSESDEAVGVEGEIEMTERGQTLIYLATQPRIPGQITNSTGDQPSMWRFFKRFLS